MADPKIYQGVTRDAFLKLRASLEKANVTLPPGDSGEISSRGVHGTFRYDEPAQTLELHLEKIPMFIPKAILWASVDGAVADAVRAG